MRSCLKKTTRKQTKIVYEITLLVSLCTYSLIISQMNTMHFDHVHPLLISSNTLSLCVSFPSSCPLYLFIFKHRTEYAYGCLYEDCSRETRKRHSVSKVEEMCCQMLSSGNDMTVACTNSQQVYLPSQDLQNIKAVKILARHPSGPTSS